MVLGLFAALGLGAGAASPVSPPPRPAGGAAPLALLGGPGGDLAGRLREFVLTGLPQPLFEDHRKWGLQKKGPLGKMRNDGRWWRVTVTGRDLRDTLLLDVRDVATPRPGTTAFTLHLVFDAGVLLERQTWVGGARLYSGSTRARLRLRLTLGCEAVTRLEKNGSWLPDAVIRLRVVRSDFRYDNLVVEHTAGLSGEAAKLLGDAFVGGLRRWKPSLERRLVEKANAAVVKAADTKEVRVSLLGLMGAKPGKPAGK
jgi:hypothetical protein